MAALVQPLEQQDLTTAADDLPQQVDVVMPVDVDVNVDVQVDEEAQAQTPAGANADADDAEPPQMAEEIDASIRRGAVEPGSGVKRFQEVGQALWTDTDQAELDRLLAEGRDVYVPPDVDDMDLPVPRARGYSYTVRKHPPISPSPTTSTATSTTTTTATATIATPTTPTPTPVDADDHNDAVDQSPNHRSMAERIAQWNQVVPKNNSAGSSSNILTPIGFSSNRQIQSDSTKSSSSPNPPSHPTTTEHHQSHALPFPDPSSQPPTDQPPPLNNHQDRSTQSASPDPTTTTDHPTSTPVPIPLPADMSSSQEPLQHHHPDAQLTRPHDPAESKSISTPPPPLPYSSTADADDRENQNVNQPLPPSTSTTMTTTTPSNTLTPTKSPRPAVDVSKTIFGGTFLTVPVVSKQSQHESLALDPSSAAPAPSVAPADGEDAANEGATVHDVLLRCESTARVDVTADFGLKGGHSSVVHDATFVHRDRKLVTCGSDGKVCIWDMHDRSVQYEFVPYDGEAVTMVYPLDGDDDEDDDDHEHAYTLITLSQSRLLRIWLVDGAQAIMLRNSPIKASDSDLYMTVTPISAALKKKAIAAAAAAAVTTSDQPADPDSLALGTAPAPESSPDPQPDADHDEVEEDEEDEEERERKRFSLSKVLSFTKSTSGRKAVAS